MTARKEKQAWDFVVIGLWALVAMAAILTRREFIGDGLRHLVPVMAGEGPHLGAPRWLLFPLLTYAWIRPMVALGMIHDLPGAILPMLLLCFGSGVVYLAALRCWLKAHGIGMQKRAACLAIAGWSAPLLCYGTDIAEPLVAAAIALCGLAYAAYYGRNGKHESRSVLVAVGAIALGSLLYQGVSLAVFLIPLAVPLRKFRGNVLWGAAGILMLVPALILAGTLLQGWGLSESWKMMWQGEPNDLYRTFLKKSGPFAWMIAWIGGLPQAFVPIPEFEGLRTVLSHFLEAPASFEGGGGVALWSLGVGLSALTAIGIFRQQKWELCLALLGIMLLPMIRHQQYAYLKFYILLPVVMAFALSIFSTRTLVLAAGLLFCVNTLLLGGGIHSGRMKYRILKPLYSGADGGTCWLTSDWTAPLPQFWPGKTTPLLGTLTLGSRENPETVTQQNIKTLIQRTRDCFCDSQEVWTTNVLTSKKESLEGLFRHFEFEQKGFLDAIMLETSPSYRIGGGSRFAIYRYPDKKRKAACTHLKKL